MKKSRLSFFTILLFAFIISLLLPNIVSAEDGMNPSVVINFSGLEDVLYYVTLLSKTDTSGPYSALTTDYKLPYYRNGQKDYDIFLKFLNYQDKDGYYFLQYFSKCSDNEPFQLGYYPPAVFKILVYFPETATFAVSDLSYQRYAFDSYFKADVSAYKSEPTSRNFTFTAAKDYDFKSGITSFIVRIVITILLKICIALLFGYNTKTHLLIISLTNLITQTLMNLLLSFINYNQGHTVFLLAFVLLAVVVFAIEAAVYSYSFGYYLKKQGLLKGSTLLYAFAANVASFIIGFWITYLTPGFF